MKRFTTAVCCSLALAFATAAPAQDNANVLKAEQLVRRAVGARIALRTYATLVIPANALAADATIIAELDLDSNTLSVNTQDGQKLAGRVTVEINIDRFPNGLTVLLQAPKPTTPPISASKLVFSGTITSVDPKNRTLAVDNPEEFREIAVPAGTTIRRQENDEAPRLAQLSDLAPGDAMEVVYYIDRKTPQSLTARCKTASGIVRSVAARRLVLEPNRTFNINQNARVTNAKGEELEAADLKVGQTVNLRMNPTTNEAWEISLGPLRAHSAIVSVSHDAMKDLGPGDSVTVTLVASPSDGSVGKGIASFELEGIRGAFAMRETAAGSYSGRYTVPAGSASLPSRALVIASFTSAAGAVEQRAADQPVRFAAALAPPKTGFEAPKLSSPKDGEVAGNSIIIKGRTAPNAKVLVKTSYVRKGLLNTRGNLPDLELRADARGDFESQPVALRGPRILEDEVEYTLTISATRADGKQSDDAVVKVIRK